MAAADYGQFGGSQDDDQDYLRSEVERALICRAYNWQVLPWEMDELDVAEVRVPLAVVKVYDTFKHYAADIESLTPEEVEIVGNIERLRQAVEDDGSEG